jgi:hypothetical protein
MLGSNSSSSSSSIHTYTAALRAAMPGESSPGADILLTYIHPKAL